jgi:hypothetical protein
MFEQTDSSKDQTGWSASVTAVPAYTYSILFYVTLHCWPWHTKLWCSFLYQLLERMLLGGATAVHRAKHAFLQLSGWYLTLHKAHSYFSKFSKSLCMVALHLIIHEISLFRWIIPVVLISILNKSVCARRTYTLIQYEISSSLGSLFGLGMVSHVSTHLLLTALQLNNCWYQPQTKHNSLYALQSCADVIVLQHTNLKFNTTQRNIVCTYRPTQCIR